MDIGILDTQQLALIEQIMRRATLAAAGPLQGSLWMGQGSEERKSDGSIATAVDTSSQEIIVPHMVAGLIEFGLSDGVTVVAEEMKFATLDDIVSSTTRYVIFVDPQDGTALGRMGAPGMTAGAQLVDVIDGHIMAGVVVDPSGRRVMYTESGRTYVQELDPVYLQPIGMPLWCQVSDKSLIAKGATVLIEVQHGFERRDWTTAGMRQVLNNYQVPLLTRMIQQIGQTSNGEWGYGPGVRSCSSNLMHHLLVALGGAEAFITTAVGGPWDITNVVQGASGCMEYLRLERTLDGVILVETVTSLLMADLIIGGNTAETVQTLRGLVEKVVNLGH